MPIFDFVTDNSGQPDAYTVQKECRRIRVVEKDLTIATLAKIRIHQPVGSSTYEEIRNGEAWIYEPGTWILPYSQPFATETVNVASTTLTVREE